MELYVDGQQIESPFDEGMSLEDALRQVQTELRSAGRLVAALDCDEASVLPEEMASTLAKPVDSFRRVDLTTSTSAELITQALSEALTSLKQSGEECERVANWLTEGRVAEAMDALGECMVVWQQIHEAVIKSIQMLGVDIRRIEVDGHPLMEVLTRPKETLFQVREALQSQDHVLLADTLKYELPDVTRDWHDAIEALRQEAASQPATADDST